MIKPIPGYKFYSISDDGIVYYKGIELPQTKDKWYKKISIGGKTIAVHRLVALTYLGDIEGKVILHLDDNPSNNCVSNLRIGTYSDNMQDMHSKGRWKYGKVHEIDIGIANVIKSGLSTKEIVEKYGVHRNTVLFWKKKLGINTNNKYDISFINNVINYDGSNTKTGKHFGISDVTVMRWRRKYSKYR